MFFNLGLADLLIFGLRFFSRNRKNEIGNQFKKKQLQCYSTVVPSHGDLLTKNQGKKGALEVA